MMRRRSEGRGRGGSRLRSLGLSVPALLVAGPVGPTASGVPDAAFVGEDCLSRHDSASDKGRLDLLLDVISTGGGSRRGLHLAFDRARNYPLPNLFVSMLRRIGIEETGFGPSTSTMKPASAHPRVR